MDVYWTRCVLLGVKDEQKHGACTYYDTFKWSSILGSKGSSRVACMNRKWRMVMSVQSGALKAAGGLGPWMGQKTCKNKKDDIVQQGIQLAD